MMRILPIVIASVLMSCGGAARETEATAAPDALTFVEEIDASTEDVWHALTTPEMTQQFFHGTAVRSELRRGAAFQHLSADGDQIIIDGVVRDVRAPNRLTYGFRFPEYDDAETTVTYTLAELGEGRTRLTIRHDGFDGRTQTYRRVTDGWPPVLAGLKEMFAN